MGFHVGDEVISHAPANLYSITYKGWRGYVTEVFKYPYCRDDIRVCEVMEDGMGYTVESKYFEVINSNFMDEDIEALNKIVSGDDFIDMIFDESN